MVRALLPLLALALFEASLAYVDPVPKHYIGWNAQMTTNVSLNTGDVIPFDYLYMWDQQGLNTTGFNTSDGTYMCSVDGLYQVSVHIGVLGKATVQVLLKERNFVRMTQMITGVADHYTIEGASIAVHCEVGHWLSVTLTSCEGACPVVFSPTLTRFSGYLVTAD